MSDYISFIQTLCQDTESLWPEFGHQCSQSSQYSGERGDGGVSVEHDQAELMKQWRGQQSALHRRGSSLGAALRQIDSTEHHVVDFSERLDCFIREPKDINAFTLANTNILTDIKVHNTAYL